MRSDVVLTSDFCFVTSTLFSMCFAMDVDTTHSKKILTFFAYLNLMNGTIKAFSSSFLKMGDLHNCQRCTFWSSSFLKQGNL